MARLARVVSSLPEGLELPVVLRDGSVATVRAAGGAGGPLRTAAGREVLLAALHPVVVIAWAGHDPGEPLLDAGVGLAIAEGYLPLARSIAETLHPRLPPAVEFFLAETYVDECILKGKERGEGVRDPPDSAGAFLARALRELRAERSARAALLAGSFGEAAAALDSLRSAEEPPAVSALSRRRWDVLRARAERLSVFSSRVFARPAAAVDPLRGEALSITYPFDGEAELADFRLDGRFWTLREGAIERRPGQPGKTPSGKWIALADPVDTVALFSPPVVLEGEWSVPERGRAPGRPGSRIAVGFAGCFVALGGPAGPIAWRGELQDRLLPHDEAQGGESAAGERRFRIEFRDGAAVVHVAGKETAELSFPPELPPAIPAPGRVAIGLSPGARLLRISITGAPDPVWGEERIAALRTAPQK
jgi:hypothetical protein